jgi:hypothetical protein
MRRELRLASFRRALVEIGTQIENMRQMVDERRQIDQAQVLDKQERALQKMTQFHDVNIARLEQAHAALQAFRQQVQQKLFEWQFAQAGQVVMNAMRPAEVADLMQDLLTDEALRSVQSHFNQVFAELDIEMRALDAPTRLFAAEGLMAAVRTLGAAGCASALPTLRWQLETARAARKGAQIDAAEALKLVNEPPTVPQLKELITVLEQNVAAIEARPRSIWRRS